MKRFAVWLLFAIAVLEAGAEQEYRISTFAGGAPPRMPAPGLGLSIGSPLGIAVDAEGNIYFTSLNCVFRQSPDGLVNRIAGTSRPGYSGDDGPATSAQLHLEGSGFGGTGGGLGPAGLAVDSSGNVFVADVLNHRIRRISPDGSIRTVAGNGTKGFSGDGGRATDAQLAFASGITVNAAGYLFIADSGNVRVRQVSPDGTITTVAGNGAYSYLGAENDGIPATNSQLGYPTAIAVDGAGNLFVTESGTYRVRRISPSGIITTVAGVGPARFNCFSSGDGGPAVQAQLCEPSGIAIDPTGNLFVADTVADFDGDFRQIIRQVSRDGMISTVAGVNCDDFCPEFGGDGGLATRALLTGALSLAVDASGTLLVADPLNSRIHRIARGTIDAIAGGGTPEFVDGVQATSTNLFGPAGIASDGAGNVFIAELSGFRVRKVSPDGVIATVAGNGSKGSSGDGGKAVDAQLSYPAALTVDGKGNLYIADLDTHQVRRVSPEGIITTVAGRGPWTAKPGTPCRPSGDGGPAIDAQLCYIPALAADWSGNLFLRDVDSVRKIAPDGIISTVLNQSAPGSPGSLAADRAGNIYVGSDVENVIRRITPDGVVTIFAGNGQPGFFEGDGGLAADARITPTSLAVDNLGNVLVSDCQPGLEGCRIRRIAAGGMITTIAGNGTAGSAGDGDPALDASITWPATLAADGLGRIFIADRFANVVRVLQARPVERGRKSLNR